MADTTISGLARVLTTNSSAIIPITIAGVTYGIPVSAIITSTGSMGTGFLNLPTGTTAQRIGTPQVGSIRYNSEYKILETFDGTVWSTETLQVEYLVIGGGGSGASYYYAGGGGAGGYRSSVEGEQSGGNSPAETKLSLNINTAYQVTVGAGGAAVTTYATIGNNGENSTFATIVATGGGGGSTTYNNVNNAKNGGSGGGGGSYGGIGGFGTTNQGFNGSNGSPGAGAAGGGGGAGGTGRIATGSNIQSGGIGIYSTITGTAIARGGGGAGSMDANSAYFIALGGLGGGGNAGADYLGAAIAATAGTPNTGGGGGGACYTSSTIGAAGGSGVVIIRYPSQYTVNASAGLTSTTSTLGNKKVTTFTSGNGTITFTI